LRGKPKLFFFNCFSLGKTHCKEVWNIYCIERNDNSILYI
jgi:hypothetical protein